MNDAVKSQYDSLYASSSEMFGGGKSLYLLQNLQDELPKGSVLDVGGGDGRNALPLAEAGYAMTVVDLSKVGLQKLTDMAEERGVSITTKIADITTVSFEDMYDGVVMSFVLHHIDSEEACEVIGRLQDHTEQNGIHIIATFLNHGGLYDRAKKSGRFYPSENDVRSIYKGWSIKECLVKDVKTMARDKSGQPFKNQAIFFLAKKER